MGGCCWRCECRRRREGGIELLGLPSGHKINTTQVMLPPRGSMSADARERLRACQLSAPAMPAVHLAPARTRSRRPPCRLHDARISCRPQQRTPLPAAAPTHRASARESSSSAPSSCPPPEASAPASAAALQLDLMLPPATLPPPPDQPEPAPGDCRPGADRAGLHPAVVGGEGKGGGEFARRSGPAACTTDKSGEGVAGCARGPKCAGGGAVAGAEPGQQHQRRRRSPRPPAAAGVLGPVAPPPTPAGQKRRPSTGLANREASCRQRPPPALRTGRCSSGAGTAAPELPLCCPPQTAPRRSHAGRRRRPAGRPDAGGRSLLTTRAEAPRLADC